MTFDQWTELMSKEVVLSGDEDAKAVSKIFQMMDEDFDEEES